MTSSARLQHEADQARAGLSSALEELKSSVTTTAITNGAMTFAKDGSTAIARAAVDKALANPFAALMIGAGVAFLMMGDKKVGDALGGLVDHGKSAVKGAASSIAGMGSSAAAAASDTASGLADQATGKARDMLEKGEQQARDLIGQGQQQASELIDKGQQQARELIDKGQQQGAQMVDQAHRLLEQGRGRFEQFAQEQPILVAALGVAFGAALGASLPITAAEQKYLGGTARQAIDKSSEIAHKVADTVTDRLAGQNVAHKVSEVVEAMSTTVAQGLSRG
jgi:hypothetical protein